MKLLEDIGPGRRAGLARRSSGTSSRYSSSTRPRTGRSRSIVVDALERLALPVIRELEALCRMRLRNRPIVHCVLHHAQRGSRRQPHGAAGGGTCPRPSCINGSRASRSRRRPPMCGRVCTARAAPGSRSSCPRRPIVDIQGFTQGVVGDVNALCREAARRAWPHTAAPSIDICASLARAAQGSRAAPAPALRPVGVAAACRGAASPEAIHVSDPNELRVEAARLLVTSGGERWRRSR